MNILNILSSKRLFVFSVISFTVCLKVYAADPTIWCAVTVPGASLTQDECIGVDVNTYDGTIAQFVVRDIVDASLFSFQWSVSNVYFGCGQNDEQCNVWIDPYEELTVPVVITEKDTAQQWSRSAIARYLVF